MGEGSVRHSIIEQAASAALPRDHTCGSKIGDLLGQLHDLSTRLSNILTAETEAVDPSGYRMVADILRLRRLRDKLFGGDLFGEPAWDMLLEVYAAEWTGRKLSVSGACYASGVPSSTALRWILRLERDGWLRRIGDPSDRRRSWLILSEEAHKKICDLLSRMGAGHP
jgi:DNA-binding MarR family transcriptional regulator